MTSALENYINRILQPAPAGISQGLGEPTSARSGPVLERPGFGIGGRLGYRATDGLGARGGDTEVKDLGPIRLTPGTGTLSSCGPKASFNLLRTEPGAARRIDCGPSGPSVHGISQARILEWVAISFSRD